MITLKFSFSLVWACVIVLLVRFHTNRASNVVNTVEFGWHSEEKLFAHGTDATFRSIHTNQYKMYQISLSNGMYRTKWLSKKRREMKRELVGVRLRLFKIEFTQTDSTFGLRWLFCLSFMYHLWSCCSDLDWECMAWKEKTTTNRLIYIAKLFYILRMKIGRTHIIILNKFQFFQETNIAEQRTNFLIVAFGIELEHVNVDRGSLSWNVSQLNRYFFYERTEWNVYFVKCKGVECFDCHFWKSHRFTTTFHNRLELQHFRPCSWTFR